MQKIRPEILRARELLKTIRHAAMATVNKDGSPHNTPYKFMYDKDLRNLYWGSHPASQHSKNIQRNGLLYVVLYDSQEKGGLYIEAVNGHIAEGGELDTALKIHNHIRKKEGKINIKKNYYEGNSPQRMWSATIKNIWVNSSQRNSEGLLVKDIRVKIKRQDLL